MGIINNFPGYPDNVTQSSDGLMSKTDKIKLDTINPEDYRISEQDIDDIWADYNNK